MSFKIVEIKDKGKLDDERLIFKVLNQTNAHNYFIVHTRYVPNGRISKNALHSYWLPSKELKENDLLVIYTKKGTTSAIENTDKTTSHFFYWGLTEAIYNTSDDCAVILELNTWNTTPQVV